MQRILIVAIFFVSLSQFFFAPSPPTKDQPTGIHHSFISDQDQERRLVFRSSENSNGVVSVSNANNSDGTSKLLSTTNIINADSTRKKKNLTFCGTCFYGLQYSCNERLNYMSKRYGLPERVAKEKLMPSCGIDYSTEPYVFIHAGPHKTGTTSIQSFIYNALWGNETFLNEDKFAIPTFDELPGIFGDIGSGLNLAHCMINDYVKDGGEMNVALCNKLRNTFPRWLERHYNQSHNILIVAEDFDRVKINYQRLQYYMRPYKRLRVIVGYRRQHDWLPSWYNQIVDLYTQIYIQGKAPYPSFVEWINDRYHEFKQVHAIEVATRFRKSGKFESVDILNMHEKVGLLENLFCNHIPFANATCRGIRDGVKPTKPNIGRTHDYDRLCTKAHLSGRLPNYHKLIAHQIVKRVRDDAVKMGIFEDVDAYPKVCPNQTFLDQLLQLEMEQERMHFPTWYESQGGDEGLRKIFENSKHKLCSMDDEEVLRSGVLDPVFEGLKG